MSFAIFVTFLVREVGDVGRAYCVSVKCISPRHAQHTSFEIRMVDVDPSIDDISTNAFARTVIKDICVVSRQLV